MIAPQFHLAAALKRREEISNHQVILEMDGAKLPYKSLRPNCHLDVGHKCCPQDPLEEFATTMSSEPGVIGARAHARP